jgi:hypothetical protein
MERNRLRMIAGAGRDHPTTALVLGEREDFVQRAALLEGPRALQVVELEKHLLPGHLRQARGVTSGREINVTANTLACGADRIECDGQSRSFHNNAQKQKAIGAWSAMAGVCCLRWFP